MLKLIPNYLTYLRILLIPVLIVLFFIPGHIAAWSALGVYAIGAATDYFDGVLARQFGAVSEVGRFLDPIADKLFVATILFLLVAFDRLTGLWILPAIIILMREVFIAGLREYLAPKNVKMPVSHLAKWKTAVQMFAIGFLILGPYNHWLSDIPHMEIGQWGLTVAMILAVWTGWQYLQTALSHLND